MIILKSILYILENYVSFLIKKKKNMDNKFKLNPNFVTGLTDAEGCFSVGVYKNKKAKFKRNVKLEFTIKMMDNLNWITFYGEILF